MGVVLQIGDTHLAPGPRQADRLSALDQIEARARELASDGSLEGVVWPGDLYHGESTIADRNLLVSRVQALANLAPVVICYGNHDHPGDLDLLEQLDARWAVTVVSQPRLVRLLTTAMFVLPYPHKAGLVAAGIAKADQGDVGADILLAVMHDAAAQLAAAQAEGFATMFVAHVNVAGAESSTGQPQIGREIDLPPAWLELLPAETAVLGNHIHKHQVAGRLVYAGSIARMDFGECEAKVYLEWTRAGGGWTWVAREVAIPRQILLEGRLSREGFLLESVDGRPVLEDDDPGDLAGADVRVRFRFLKAEAGVMAVAHIHAFVAGCRSLTLDPVAILEHTVRAPAVAAAESVEEKVVAYCGIVQVEVTDGLRAKVAALQGPQLPRVLVDVAAALEAVGQGDA